MPYFFLRLFIGYGHLITKYRDGYINIPDVGKSVGYPDWWLKEVGYADGHIFGPDGYKAK